MLDRALPLLPKEQLAQPDGFDVLAADAAGFRRDTLVLRRLTQWSEVFFFLPFVSVNDGTIQLHGTFDEADEHFLLSLQARANARPASLSTAQRAELAVEPITMSLVASTIVLGMLSGIAGSIASKALDWALGKLGIADLMKQTELSYNQLVEALRLQARASYRQIIMAKAGGFHRLLQDYNAGARTPDNLRACYNEIREITSYIEQDFAEGDGVENLAFAQAEYLAVMQEQAEVYRVSGLAGAGASDGCPRSAAGRRSRRSGGAGSSS